MILTVRLPTTNVSYIHWLYNVQNNNTSIHGLERSPASEIKEVTLISHRSTYIPSPSTCPPPNPHWIWWSLLRRWPGGLDVNIQGVRKRRRLLRAPLSTWWEVLFLKQAADIHAICQERTGDGGGAAGKSVDRIMSFVGAWCINSRTNTNTHTYGILEVLAKFNNKRD